MSGSSLLATTLPIGNPQDGQNLCESSHALWHWGHDRIAANEASTWAGTEGVRSKRQKTPEGARPAAPEGGSLIFRVRRGGRVTWPCGPTSNRRAPRRSQAHHPCSARLGARRSAKER